MLTEILIKNYYINELLTKNEYHKKSDPKNPQKIPKKSN